MEPEGKARSKPRMFAQEGARVVIGDILDDLGMRVQAEINETGGECLYVHLDVTSESDWQNAVEAAVSPLRQAGCSGDQRGDRQPQERCR